MAIFTKSKEMAEGVLYIQRRGEEAAAPERPGAEQNAKVHSNTWVQYILLQEATC